MEIEEYLGYIERYEIPPEPPTVTALNDYRNLGDEWKEQLETRSTCIQYGLWIVIADTWLKPLADWIGDRKCLEIMAGGGWLTKGLENHGVSIVATDDFSWEGRHSMMVPLVHITAEDAVYAARLSPEMEIMIVSWPPYSDGQGDVIVQACDAWGEKRPIVYIGETSGGCNAPDEFFDRFAIDESAPEIDLPQWWGIHDRLLIGKWIK